MLRSRAQQCTESIGSATIYLCVCLEFLKYTDLWSSLISLIIIFCQIIALHFLCYYSSPQYLFWWVTFTAVSESFNLPYMRSLITVIGPPSCRGSYKIVVGLSVCPSAHPSFQRFSQEWIITFFWIFAWWYAIGIFQTGRTVFSKKIHFCPNVGVQNRVFWILSLFIPGNNPK